MSIFTQPWAHMPALGPSGVGALAIFIVVGSFFAYMFYMQGVKEIGSVRASLLGAGFGHHHQRPYAGNGVFTHRPGGLCHDYRDGVFDGVAGAKTEKVLCHIFAN